MAHTVIVDFGDFFNTAELREKEWTLSRLVEHLGAVIF